MAKTRPKPTNPPRASNSNVVRVSLVGGKRRARFVDDLRRYLQRKYGAGRGNTVFVVEEEVAGRVPAADGPVVGAPLADLAAGSSASSVASARVSAAAVARTREAYRTLLESSLTVAQAALRLGVDQSRVRQRLAASGDLYGFKSGGGWRLPSVLFESDGRLVSGIGRVARALPAGLTPLEVDAWLRRAHPDLYLAEFPDRDLSPVEWLSMGRDSETVIRLAEDVGVS